MARRESCPVHGWRYFPDRQANQNLMAGQRFSAPAQTPETAPKVIIGSLNGQKRRRLGPEIFQAVELTLILGEDVDEHVPEVEHNPATGRAALDTLRTNPGVRHP